MKFNYISKNAKEKLKKCIIAGSLAVVLVAGTATAITTLSEQPRYSYSIKNFNMLDTRDHSEFKTTIPIYSDESRTEKLGEASVTITNLYYASEKDHIYSITKVKYFDKNEFNFNEFSYDFCLYNLDELFFVPTQKAKEVNKPYRVNYAIEKPGISFVGLPLYKGSEKIGKALVYVDSVVVDGTVKNSYVIDRIYYDSINNKLDFDNYSYDFYLDNYNNDEDFFQDYREKIDNNDRDNLPTLTAVEKKHGEPSKIVTSMSNTKSK